MKKRIIKIIENLYLHKKHWKAYCRYYFLHRRKIKKLLKKHNVAKLRPISKNNWKLWYNTCYFKGLLKNATEGDRAVFVKIQGPSLFDCFENEKVLNSYIDEQSEFLSARKPRLFFDLVVDDYYIFVFDFIDIDFIEANTELSKLVQKALDEYTKIGVLHTDFGLINMGVVGNDTFFIDYGTSLCPESDRIRIRNLGSYNHLDKILPQAKALVSDPDYYYDDAVHCGLRNLDRNNVNFLVGKGDIVYAKLGEKTYKYHLEKKSENSVVRLLCKDGEI